MNINKQQKMVIAVCAGLIVVLGAVTILNRPDIALKDTTDYEALAKADREAQAEYQKYINSIETDPAASKKLLQDLVKEADVRAEVEAELGVKKAVVIPQIPDSALVITEKSTTSNLTQYFNRVLALEQAAEEDASGISGTVFTDASDKSKISEVSRSAASLADQLRRTPVPREAVAFHKANMVLLAEYNDALKQAESYADNQSVEWQSVYRSYAVGDAQLPVLEKELNRIDQKYALGFAKQYAEASATKGILGIKAAQAQFGTTIIADIPRIAERTLRFILARAFATYVVNYMQNVISRIKDVYQISNFLYYTDALVQGQYADDYLKKYIADATDRELIKRLIPEFNCNSYNAEELKVIYKAKAREYIGYDPNSIKPTDPDFYSKMSKLGNFFASPQGWELYISDVAAETRAEARSTAYLEQIAPGTKVSREADKQIATALKTVEKGLDKAFDSIFDVGTGNSGEGPASKIVANVMSTIFNKFVFKGAVFKEQKVCINSTVLTPITPADGSTYDNPPDETSSTK